MTLTTDKTGTLGANSCAPETRLGQTIVHLEHHDPWAYAEAMRRPGEPALLWQEPRGESFAAAGDAISAPWDRAAPLCSTIAEHVEPADGEAAPRLYIVGGAGFGPPPTERHGEGPWARWAPTGSLWLPRVVIRRVGQGCEAIVTAPIDDLTAWADWVRGLSSNRRPIDPVPPRTGYHTVDTCGEREEWTDRVSALVDKMVSPAAPFRKVVLARAQQLEAAPGRRFDAVSTAWHLRAQQPDCTCFAWWAADGSAFVGATPELLCRLEDGEVATTALAGTAPRGRTPAEDELLGGTLLAAAKEQHEHQLVVDGIVETLAGLGACVSPIAEPHIRRLEDVQHLETPIAATLPPTRSLLDVVDALHPTPAVGGVPRQEALRWLSEHEGLDRGHYAAPIGWINASGHGAFYVALRSAYLTRDCAWAFAGAGIVSDSDPAAEWREVNHKLRAIRGALTTRTEGAE